MEMLFISALMFNSNTTRPSLVKLSKLGFLLYKRLLPLTTVENIGWVGEERNGPLGTNNKLYENNDEEL
jgi:hypothetical protein